MRKAVLLPRFAAIVALLHPAALGQQAENPPPTSGPAADIDGLFDQADALRAQGDITGAAAAYRQLLDQLPLSARAQQAAFKAAGCYETLGQTRDAVEMYARTVSIGRDLLKPRYYKIDGQKQNVQVGRPDSVKDRLQRALKRQAILCQTLGEPAQGLQAIRYLAAFAPTAPAVAELIPLRLQLDGRPAAEAPEMVRQQEQAAHLCRQAQELLRVNAREAGMALLDRVLADYADTPAAIRARADKAEILWLTKRYDESEELYQQILDRVGEIAPDVSAVREGRYRIAWLDFCRQIKAAQIDVRAGTVVSDVRWEEVRAKCRIVMELDPEPVRRAEAHIALIETYNWQGRHEELLSAVHAFFRDYSSARKAGSELSRAICWARIYKGDALERLGRTEEARVQYEVILRWDADHPYGIRDDRVIRFATEKLARLTDSSP